jgi:hypothetical protein
MEKYVNYKYMRGDEHLLSESLAACVKAKK